MTSLSKLGLSLFRKMYKQTINQFHKQKINLRITGFSGKALDEALFFEKLENCIFIERYEKLGYCDNHKNFKEICLSTFHVDIKYQYSAINIICLCYLLILMIPAIFPIPYIFLKYAQDCQFFVFISFCIFFYKPIKADYVNGKSKKYDGRAIEILPNNRIKMTIHKINIFLKQKKDDSYYFIEEIHYDDGTEIICTSICIILLRKLIIIMKQR